MSVRYESTIAPIWPVPVKPKSSIASWAGWPDDVRPILAEWNRGTKERPYKLSFIGTRGCTFKCPDCEEFCAPHHTAANLNGVFFCDDCLILKAQEVLTPALVGGRRA